MDAGERRAAIARYRERKTVAGIFAVLCQATAHGAESFAFEEVERQDEEAVPYLRDRMLKERLRHWCAASGAEAI